MMGVSIIIPTWKRHGLLDHCIDNIMMQTYQDKEIIVVSDGQDIELIDFLTNKVTRYKFNINLSLIQLGHNWSWLMPKSFGIAPLLVGYLAATKEYIMPWCDDERALILDHIQNLVTILDTKPEIDFVYPQVRIWRNGDPYGPETAIIGTYPPVHGQITHYLFRQTNLVKFGMPDWGSHPVDIALVEKWLANGAKCEMLPKVTFEHRLDR